VAEENEIGDVEVVFKKGEDEEIKVDDWVKMFLASDSGKMFTSKLTGPSIKNNGKPPIATISQKVNTMEYSKKVAEIYANKELTSEQKEKQIASIQIVS
jgi:hypothetical protein